MRLVFTPRGWKDYIHWQTADRHELKRINRLIGEALRDPATGIGKPEPLKQTLAGLWSRRIIMSTDSCTKLRVTTSSCIKRATTTKSSLALDVV